MQVKYLMLDDTDYRGNVKLIVRNEQGDEIAYTEIETPTEDMVPLTEQEVGLVQEQTSTLWLAERKELQRKIDIHADQIRQSYLYNGDLTIFSEYLQVEKVLDEWLAEGSDYNNVPVEISVWAQATGNTLEWAVNDIHYSALGHRYMLANVRSIRLLGKGRLNTEPMETLYTAFNEVIAQLEQWRCPVVY